MKIKTKGRCVKCKELCAIPQAEQHILNCSLKSSTPTQQESGHLVLIAWTFQPHMYWMFVTLPKTASLSLLDAFLRMEWLECCGHLSRFTIGDKGYMSQTECGNPSQCMKKQIGQLLPYGSICDYVYDMGSSTRLTIKNITEIPFCSQKKVEILVQNEPPKFSCEFCKKEPDNICAICGETVCSSCSSQHSCVVDEGDDYVLLPLVNSPRTGVCGYTGR